MLFTINDHGGPATVIALLQSGDKLADLSLAGAENTDWEDIATTVIQGQVSSGIVGLPLNSSLIGPNDEYCGQVNSYWWTATILTSDWSRATCWCRTPGTTTTTAPRCPS